MVSCLLLSALVLTQLITVAGEKPKTPTEEEVKAARERLTEYLKGIPGTEAARVTPLTMDGAGTTFPDHVLFAVIFPQYPVARVAPPPLKSSNVIAIPAQKTAKPTAITDATGLEKFFQASARPVKTATDADAAIRTWLRAAAELHQDGFYKFTVKPGNATGSDGNWTLTGQAPVDPAGGNKGEVSATLAFKNGKLTSAKTRASLSAGIRPICQATKLLDPDPIVRAMAEQSIRVMGSAARSYLDDQRTRASPELKDAIERIWARILKEGR
jgi:hypothetical protein